MENGKKLNKKMGLCKICLSPYRKEIEGAWKAGVKRTLIYEKYKDKLEMKGNYANFYQMYKRHKYHFANPAMIVPSEAVQTSKRETSNFESLVKRITDLGYAKVENMTPEELKLNDVWSANRVMIDMRKQKLEENQMMMALAKMFGPVIEGVYEDPEKLQEEKERFLSQKVPDSEEENAGLS